MIENSCRIETAATLGAVAEVAVCVGGALLLAGDLIQAAAAPAAATQRAPANRVRMAAAVGLLWPFLFVLAAAGSVLTVHTATGLIASFVLAAWICRCAQAWAVGRDRRSYVILDAGFFLATAAAYAGSAAVMAGGTEAVFLAALISGALAAAAAALVAGRAAIAPRRARTTSSY